MVNFEDSMEILNNNIYKSKTVKDMKNIRNVLLKFYNNFDKEKNINTIRTIKIDGSEISFTKGKYYTLKIRNNTNFCAEFEIENMTKLKFKMFIDTLSELISIYSGLEDIANMFNIYIPIDEFEKKLPELQELFILISTRNKYSRDFIINGTEYHINSYKPNDKDKIIVVYNEYSKISTTVMKDKDIYKIIHSLMNVYKLL